MDSKNKKASFQVGNQEAGANAPDSILFQIPAAFSFALPAFPVAFCSSRMLRTETAIATEIIARNIK
jgi:hypothetical protein